VPTHFTFTVPGQPLSWNRSYRNRVVIVRDRLGAAMHTAKGAEIRRPATYKTEEARIWQEGVRLIARAAKPSGFDAAQIIVAYDFILARDIDCDNVMKMMNDAIADAIGLNDRNFYPVVLSKVRGSKDPSVTVNVYDRKFHAVEIVDVPSVAAAR